MIFIAAQMPNLSNSIATTAVITGLVASIVALFVGIGMADSDFDGWRAFVGGVIAWLFTAGVIITVAVVIYAASWEDYRRSLGR